MGTNAPKEEEPAREPALLQVHSSGTQAFSYNGAAFILAKGIHQ